MISSGTPRTDVLTLFAYDVTDPRKYSDDPGTEVIRAAMVPPVHDSAAESVFPEAFISSPMQDSNVSSLYEYRYVPKTGFILANSASILASSSSFMPPYIDSLKRTPVRGLGR